MKDAKRARRGGVLTPSQELKSRLFIKAQVLAGYDESKSVGSEDADELRSDNKVFRSKLDFFEEGRQQVEYKALKAQLIQKVADDAWRKAVEQATLSELVKMADMNTTWSHVLNCELYKVLAGYDKSKVVGSKDANELCSDNKVIRSKLGLVEEGMQ
ncbi:hypothetical protein Fot_47889 [Forsythia ovata]